MAKTEVSVSLSSQYIAFTVVIVAAVLLIIGFVVWTQTPAHQSLITISSSATVTANPAQSSIYLSLNGTGSTSAAAVGNLSTITAKLNTTLAPFLNGNSSLIQTLSYNVYPANNCTITYYPIYPSTTTACPSPRKFYVATEYLQVTIPNVGNTNPALLGLSGINGVNINSVSAKLSAQQQANMSQRALALALSNATSQAQALVTGGRHLSIVNITVQNNYVLYAGGSVFSSSAPVSNQTFFPGRGTVTKNIYVVFSMQ